MALNDTYATVEELKDRLDITSNTEDELLIALCKAASRMIDNYLGRKPRSFYSSTDSTLYFTGSGGDELWIPELAATPTSVSVAETGDLDTYTLWSSSDYFEWPYNYADEEVPIMRLDINPDGAEDYWPNYPKAVKIVGKFGFSTTPPEEIKLATIIQTVRWFKRNQQSWADTGAIVELGQLRYTQKLDPDVEQILSAPKFSYRRITI